MGQPDSHKPKTRGRTKSGQDRWRTHPAGGIAHRAGAAAEKPVRPRRARRKTRSACRDSRSTVAWAAVPRRSRAQRVHRDTGVHQPPTLTLPGRIAAAGAWGDLGAQQDQRRHGLPEDPEDPAECRTGADTPNVGGIAGSPGGPTEATRVPDLDDDQDATTGSGQSGIDAQRDPQI